MFGIAYLQQFKCRVFKEYQGALDAADVAVVFYSPDAVTIKKLEEVTYEQIEQAFNREDLIIYTNPEEFKVVFIGAGFYRFGFIADEFRQLRRIEF